MLYKCVSHISFHWIHIDCSNQHQIYDRVNEYYGRNTAQTDLVLNSNLIWFFIVFEADADDFYEFNFYQYLARIFCNAIRILKKSEK